MYKIKLKIMKKIVLKIKKQIKNNPNKKIVVWFVGSFSSGKTTQAKLIYNQFSKEPIIINRKIKEDIWLKASLFNEVSNIGITSDKQCSGADTINNKFTRRLSVAYCAKNSNIVLVDGALFSNVWWEMFLKNFDKILLVLLKHDNLESNLDFLRKRRANNKNNTRTLDFEERTVKNMISKIKGADSLYNNADSHMRENDKKIKINSSLPEGEINLIILRKIYNMLRK